MHTFANARSAVQHSLFALLLLSASTQAQVLFAPAVFTTAPPQATSAADSTHSGLLTTALQPAAANRQQPVSSPPSPWIGPSKQAIQQPNTDAPKPPRLRF